ncbi:hypothetical protein [uncultured Clostridium sp.]|uniref:hypothetical protein n=1 Tax=uncultured Clostridium sp. TaxID=59620 RepID=UPI0025E839DF|nr:hypothetical protein [uncultured Clostridium sp.]
MSKCPFWSTNKKTVDCYKECPMMISENGKISDEDQCIFQECLSNDMSFKDIIKDDYSFLGLSSYDDDKKSNVNI